MVRRRQISYKSPTALKNGLGKGHNMHSLDLFPCISCRRVRVYSLYCDRCIKRFNTGGFPDYEKQDQQ